MKHIIALHLFLSCAFSYSQNYQIKKIVFDKNSKIPLENVIISNEKDNTTTNADGKFIFVSSSNKINLNLLGYEGVNTSFEKLKSANDTIFMESKATLLDEVVVSNTIPFMKKVYDKMKDNYLPNYTVNFFLRDILKKGNGIVILQDVHAKENHNSSKKTKLSIEIMNMRKTSLFEKKDPVSFRFPDFDLFFDIRFPFVDKCNFTEVAFNDSEFKKVLFETNEKNEWGQIWKGYFIIHRNNYAIVEYSLTSIDNPEAVPYIKQLISSGKYKTTKYNRFVQYAKDTTSNKYYPSNSILDCQMEVFVNKKTETPVYYDYTMDYFVTNKPSNEKINPNFPPDKDIFKAKFPYSKDFWNNQNQLPLTTDLEMFLKSVADKKDKNKEYEIIGNF